MVCAYRQRHNTRNRARLESQKAKDAKHNCNAIYSTTNAETFFVRRREQAKKLHSMTPSEEEIMEQYLVLTFDNPKQHTILRTREIITKTMVDLVLDKGDDSNKDISLFKSCMIYGNTHGEVASDSTTDLAIGRSQMISHSFPMGTVPVQLMETLRLSNQNLNDAWPSAAVPQSSNRGVFSVRHIACWWKVGRKTEPFMNCGYLGTSRNAADRQLQGSSVPNGWIMPTNVDPDVAVFLRRNAELWRFLQSLVRTHYPTIYNILDRLILPPGCTKVAGIFTGLAINNHVKTSIHRDSGDWPLGLCVVVSFGDAKGGQLAFKEEIETTGADGKRLTYSGVILPGLTGSVTMFRSALVRHFNLSYTEGSRHSIVLFTDNNLLNYEPNKWISSVTLI